MKAKTFNTKVIIAWFIAVLLSLTTLTSNAQDKPTCKATTTKGQPCKGTILLKDGNCQAHSTTTLRCGANTSKNTPCKIPVKKAGDKCRHHN